MRIAQMLGWKMRWLYLREAEAFANSIAALPYEAWVRGTFNFTRWLMEALLTELPPPLAEEVMTRFQRRCSRGFPHSAEFLKWDIVMAWLERDYCAGKLPPKKKNLPIDEPYVEKLCRGVRTQFAAEVRARLKRRLLLGCDKAKQLLKADAVMAHSESEHYASTFTGWFSRDV